MWSAHPGRWRELAFYAGLAAEVAAWIVLGFLIAGMAVMLNPSLANGGPIEDRWPRPDQQFVLPNAFLAMSFINAWDVASAGEARPAPPGPNVDDHPRPRQRDPPRRGR